MEKNIDEAVNWLRKAASLGNQDAMLKLGTLLYNDRRLFSDIIVDYENKLRKSSEEIDQWKTAYNMAGKAVKEVEEKYREKLNKVSEQEYIAGYNDAKVGKRNKYIKKEAPKIVSSSVLFGNITVGNVVKLGNYPQNIDGDLEPLEWIVLSIDNKKALLLSKHLIDYIEYNGSTWRTAWWDCTLQKWLNTCFIVQAFNILERSYISPCKLSFDFPETRSFSCNIFCLSKKEVYKYIGLNGIGKATEWAKNKSGYLNKEYNWIHSWWLRDIDNISCNIANYVTADGEIHYMQVDTKKFIRPALWIKL